MVTAIARVAFLIVLLLETWGGEKLVIETLRTLSWCPAPERTRARGGLSPLIPLKRWLDSASAPSIFSPRRHGHRVEFTDFMIDVTVWLDGQFFDHQGQIGAHRRLFTSG